jgi:hypothetical protein
MSIQLLQVATEFRRNNEKVPFHELATVQASSLRLLEISIREVQGTHLAPGKRSRQNFSASIGIGHI